MNQRRFLLLQGPKSPFFRRLARRMRREGHGALTITFNAGDAMFAIFGSKWRAYTGTIDEWPLYLRCLQEEHLFTDLVVYNDCRPYHAKAIKILRDLGVRTHVLEEGYFRPYRVTYESQGVNGYSFFYPCTPEKIEALKKRLPIGFDAKVQKESTSKPVQKEVRRIFGYAVIYYLAMALSPLFYPHYSSHRSVHPLKEAMAWFFKWVAYPFDSLVSHVRQRKLIKSRAPFALLLLQLSEDSQIRVHSPYGASGVVELIERVVEDFAANAPKDLVLVIKNHPLDSGLISIKSALQKAAVRYGVSERTVYLDKGHLPTLLRRAKMAITVNSTSGTSALHHRKPLICLGRAVYDCPGLTYQGSLSRFWHEASRPSAAFCESFRAVLCAKTQIRGSFYTSEGVQDVLQGLFRFRPFSGDPNSPDIGDDEATLSLPSVIH